MPVCFLWFRNSQSEQIRKNVLQYPKLLRRKWFQARRACLLWNFISNTNSSLAAGNAKAANSVARWILGHLLTSLLFSRVFQVFRLQLKKLLVGKYHFLFESALHMLQVFQAVDFSALGWYWCSTISQGTVCCLLHQRSPSRITKYPEAYHGLEMEISKCSMLGVLPDAPVTWKFRKWKSWSRPASRCSKSHRADRRHGALHQRFSSDPPGQSNGWGRSCKENLDDHEAARSWSWLISSRRPYASLSSSVHAYGDVVAWRVHHDAGWSWSRSNSSYASWAWPSKVVGALHNISLCQSILLELVRHILSPFNPTVYSNYILTSMVETYESRSQTSDARQSWKQSVMIPRATKVKYFKEDWLRENTYRHLKHNQDMLQETFSTRLSNDAKGCVTGDSRSNRFEYQKLSAFSQTCSHVSVVNLTLRFKASWNAAKASVHCLSKLRSASRSSSLKNLGTRCKSAPPRVAIELMS